AGRRGASVQSRDLKGAAAKACPLGLPRAAFFVIRQSEKGKKSSDSPGQPEPLEPALSDRSEAVAKRRARVPPIIVEGTAPPHVRPAAFGPLGRRPLPHIPDHVA